MADADDTFAAVDEGLGEEVELEEDANAEGAATGQEDPYEHLYKYHPETILDYAETIAANIPLQSVPAGPAGKDEKHMSPPFLTVFERTKILGTRANQIADGARPFIVVPEHVTQPLEIAKMELEQRRLPYIIKRPMPDGTFEYWRLSDLLIL